MGRSKASNNLGGNGGGNGNGNSTATNRAFAHKNQQDVQHAINYHWSTVPDGTKKLLVEMDHKMNLHKLINFWNAQPFTLCEGTRTSTMCGSSWYLALNYMKLGKVRAARNLLLNGGFLQEAYYTPMSNIINYAATPVATTMLPRYHAAFDAAWSSVDKMGVFLKKAMPSDYQRMMNFASQTAHGPVREYVNMVASDWQANNSCNSRSSSNNNGSRRINSEIMITIVLLDEETNETCEVRIGQTMPLRSLFNDYAQVRDTSLRSLRFSHKGRTLFLSSTKNKTPEQLGLNDNDTIVVTDLTPASKQEEETVTTTPSNSNNVKSTLDSSSRSRRGKKSKKKKTPAQQHVIEKTEEELKIEHSKMLTKIHEEAQPQFKQTRQRLNNLLIERSRPKNKSRRPKFVPSLPQTVMNMNPPTTGLGGKAGKPQYFVQVGEVQNLYKTSKPRCGSPARAMTIDLHGITKTEAINLLNESLPHWIDIAMSGLYPFVMPVNIICGCGNQILSEAVEKWIKRNDAVSNAPKNLWVPQRNCPYPYAA